MSVDKIIIPGQDYEFVMSLEAMKRIARWILSNPKLKPHDYLKIEGVRGDKIKIIFEK